MAASIFFSATQALRWVSMVSVSMPNASVVVFVALTLTPMEAAASPVVASEKPLITTAAGSPLASNFCDIRSIR